MYLDPSDPQYKLFVSQLEVLRLRLHDVPGDGNCLFRALADQLDDGTTTHEAVRSAVVQYIRQHEAEFSPFVEEGVSFDSYIAELSKDGEHGGNDSIVAFARHYVVDVLIHQLDLPLWEVRVPGARRQAQIAYLNGEHYCSVRPLLERNPSVIHPAYVPLRAQCAEVPGGSQEKTEKALKDNMAGKRSDQVQNLMEATNCTDPRFAQECLEESGYDLDAAIVQLLQLMDLGATDLLQDEAAAVAGAQLLRDECTSGENCDTASQPDRIATKTSATAACSKHSTPGASGKRLRQEAKMARKARRAEEQRQKVQRPPPTKTEHPGGSSICI
eukprot:Em0008g1015a